MRLIDADKLTAHVSTVAEKARIKALQYSGVDFENWKMSITVAATFEQCKGYISDAPTVDAVPVIRCRDCKYFETDHFQNVSGVPLILAHNICKRWGYGFKTNQNGYCFLAERRDDETD